MLKPTRKVVASLVAPLAIAGAGVMATAMPTGATGADPAPSQCPQFLAAPGDGVTDECVDDSDSQKKADEKDAADKKAAEKDAADKEAADEKAAEKAAADKEAADKKADEKAAADKEAADKKAAEKQAADEQAAEKKAADQAAAEKHAADKAAQEAADKAERRKALEESDDDILNVVFDGCSKVTIQASAGIGDLVLTFADGNTMDIWTDDVELIMDKDRDMASVQVHGQTFVNQNCNV